MRSKELTHLSWNIRNLFFFFETKLNSNRHSIFPQILLFRRLMKKRNTSLQGTLNDISENQIYLNINHLKNGQYDLKIMFNNKVIKETTFQKPT